MIKKVLLSFGLGVFILIAGFAGPSPSTADSNFSNSDNRFNPGNLSKAIAGTYVVSRDSKDGPSRILTIFADGNFSSIQSIQFAGGVGGFPFSDQQGAWKRTGHRKIKATVLNINYLSNGQFNGIAIAAYDLEFSENFRTITGVSSGKIYAPGVDPQNPDEDPIDTFEDNFTAERVIVENGD